MTIQKPFILQEGEKKSFPLVVGLYKGEITAETTEDDIRNKTGIPPEVPFRLSHQPSKNELLIRSRKRDFFLMRRSIKEDAKIPFWHFFRHLMQPKYFSHSA